MSKDKTAKVSPVPPIPVGLEELVGMAAASEEFAAALVARREEAVLASGVVLAPTEAAVLRAVDAQTLSRMVDTCRDRQADGARREFLARASTALLLLVGAGAVAACEKQSGPGGNKQTTPAPKPPAPGKMRSPEMRPESAPPSDAAVPRKRPEPQVTAGVRPPRPRPKRPSGVKTGISPEHRRPDKLDVDTGSRPD